MPSDDAISLFVGSGIVAEQCLNWLIQANYEISHVVLSKMEPELVDACIQAGIKYSKFSSRKSNLSVPVRIVASVWFPHVIREDDLRLGQKTLNIHPGIVPKYRGNDSATWCILERGKAGISLLEMTNQIDGGGIWMREVLETSGVMTGGELLELLRLEAIRVFQENFEAIYSGVKTPVPQESSGRIITRKMTDNDRKRTLDSFAHAEEFFLWALAHNHGPKSLPELSVAGRVFRVELK